MTQQLQPNNVLSPGLYAGDNGRILCHECSGITARTTGRDLSGRPVLLMTANDNAEWLRALGQPMRCERCGVQHNKLP